jgi:hypothetical protein
MASLDADDAAEVSELSSLSPSPSRGRPSLLLRAASSPPPPASRAEWYLCAPLQASLLDGLEGLVSLPFSQPPVDGGVCSRARHLFCRVLAYAGPGLLISIGYMVRPLRKTPAPRRQNPCPNHPHPILHTQHRLLPNRTRVRTSAHDPPARKHRPPSHAVPPAPPNRQLGHGARRGVGVGLRAPVRGSGFQPHRHVFASAGGAPGRVRRP